MEKNVAIERMKKYAVEKKVNPLSVENVRGILQSDLPDKEKLDSINDLCFSQEQKNNGFIQLPSSPEDKDLADAIMADKELFKIWKEITNQN